MGRRSLLALFVLLGLLVTAAAPSVALQGTDFESTDGNLVVNSTKDWASFIGQVAIGQDKPTGAVDDSLGQGSKDDLSTPSVTTGAIPNNKSDLDRFYVASENIGGFPGKDFLYLAWTRNNTIGTANMSIELNQLTQPAPPAAGPWPLARTVGDLLILFDFASGGKESAVKLSSSQWVTSGNPKTVCQANNSVPCWGKTKALGSAVADGSVNTSANNPPDGAVIDPLNGGKTLPVLTFGEAAINLTDAGLLPNLCIGFGSAMLRSRASSAFNAELKDFIAPIRVSITRSPDPTTAHANKSALGAKVDDVSVLGGANPLNLPSPPGTDPSVQTSQTGPNSGPNTATAEQLNVVVPADGSVLTADLIRATSASTVGAMGAAHTSVAEAVDVNILDGVVTADVVRGAAQTTATNLASSFSAASSTFKNLRVNGGPPQNDVAPNSRVGLPALSFGEGSYVGLYELGPDPTLKTGTTSQPPVGQVGTFAADLTVTMIRVHITDDNGSLLPGGNPAEIIVSKAIAHSDFRGIRCTNREVSGHAFMVFEDTDPSLAPALVGWVAIPRSGGAQHQHLEAIDLSPAVAAEASDSDSTGDVGGDRSEATSYAQVADVCVLPTPTGCTISAAVLRAASHSVANATSRSSDDADTQVVATIQGNSVLAQMPNTKIDLEGLGYVILNEQFCDQGASLAGGCAIGNHAGLTVRALHVVITVPDNPFGLQAGVEIIVCEAHSDATFVS